MAGAWNGQPSTLWRKRFARHIRDCDCCSGSGADLLPAERLLANLGLVPLPGGYLAYVLSQSHHGAAPAATASRLPGREHGSAATA